MKKSGAWFVKPHYCEVFANRLAYVEPVEFTERERLTGPCAVDDQRLAGKSLSRW